MALSVWNNLFKQVAFSSCTQAVSQDEVLSLRKLGVEFSRGKYQKTFARFGSVLCCYGRQMVGPNTRWLFADGTIQQAEYHMQLLVDDLDNHCALDKLSPRGGFSFTKSDFGK